MGKKEETENIPAVGNDFSGVVGGRRWAAAEEGDRRRWRNRWGRRRCLQWRRRWEERREHDARQEERKGRKKKRRSNPLGQIETRIRF